MSRSFFKDGFPLEKPDVVLLWGSPLYKMASTSGGVWVGDRYIWKDIEYLKGLKYMLATSAGNNQQEMFKTISAYIGLTAEGLWSDEVALQGYHHTFSQLMALFGEPDTAEINREVPDVKDLTWRLDGARVKLIIIEQHCYKCYLNIRYS